MKHVPYPEENDPVFMKDGRVGAATAESPVSMDEGDWQIEVEFKEEDESGDTLIPDIQVGWDSEKSGWVEL